MKCQNQFCDLKHDQNFPAGFSLRPTARCVLSNMKQFHSLYRYSYSTELSGLHSKEKDTFRSLTDLDLPVRGLQKKSYPEFTELNRQGDTGCTSSVRVDSRSITPQSVKLLNHSNPTKSWKDMFFKFNRKLHHRLLRDVFSLLI